MQKLDFIKNSPELYKGKLEPEIVLVPPMHFLMYDGAGLPEESDAFQKAFQALYGIAYALKFAPKRHAAPKGFQDFKIPPPEGLWWTAGHTPLPDAAAGDWRWRLMLRVPEFVTQTLLDEVAGGLAEERHNNIYRHVKLGDIAEGEAVQILHVGPYEREAVSLERMHRFAAEAGYHYIGKHHEIYIGDPRRSQPQRLKTLLRQPVTR